MRPVIILAAALSFSGCVAKPVLYPNAKYSEAGKQQAKDDVAACDKLADDYIKARKNQKIAGDVVEGGAMGAAAGAVSGAIFGDLGRGAMAGGAGGAAVGLVRGIFRTRQPSPARQSFVNRCLHDKGYEVVGWE